MNKHLVSGALAATLTAVVLAAAPTATAVTNGEATLTTSGGVTLRKGECKNVTISVTNVDPSSVDIDGTVEVDNSNLNRVFYDYVDRTQNFTYNVCYGNPTGWYTVYLDYMATNKLSGTTHTAELYVNILIKHWQPPCVTDRESYQIKRGMTPYRVRQIFGVAPDGWIGNKTPLRKILTYPGCTHGKTMGVLFKRSSRTATWRERRWDWYYG